MAHEENPNEPSIADLPLHDRLLHGIGRVAQAQVSLDLTLRRLYLDLAGAPAGHLVVQVNSAKTLARNCQVMWDSMELDNEVKAAGDEALTAAKDADNLRDRTVHDHWVQKSGANDPAGYTRRRVDRKTISFTEELSDLTYVDNTEAQLLHADIRVAAMSVVVNSTLGGTVSVPTDLLPLAQIRGEFTLLSDGSHQLHGPSDPRLPPA
jgi:hypothetical protein